MKKKGPRQIPDFSTKRGNATFGRTPDLKPQAMPHTPAPIVKPKATSAKSGRRGQ